MKKLIATLLVTPVAFLATSAIANTEQGTVQVPSLQVKERLHSIEQINVTAEKAPVDVKPESEAVAKLLEEADAMDRAEEEAQAPQSAVH